MNAITRFEIKNLHGNKDIDLELLDNTLILVGENGVGKTTVVQLLFYTLSGQWLAMAKYQFESVTVTIDDQRYTLPYTAIKRSFQNIDRRILSGFPPSFRDRVIALLENVAGECIPPELEWLCERYGVPLHLLLRDLGGLSTGPLDEETKSLRKNSEAIQASLGAQLLYCKRQIVTTLRL